MTKKAIVIIGALALLCSTAWSQCGSMAINPTTGKLDCTGPTGVGTGTVTSVDVAGTAGQITVTGTSPITDSGTLTLSLAYNGVNPQTGTSYALLTGDRGKLVTLTNGSAIGVSIAAAGSTGFADGWEVTVLNSGVGTATITPATSTIEGAATLVLTTGQAAKIWSNGSNYRVALGGGGDMVAATYVTSGAGAPSNPCSTIGIGYINTTPTPRTFYSCPANGGNWVGPFALASSIGTAGAATLGTGSGQVPVTGDYQPSDADLTAIAALSCTENQIIKRNGAGAWVCAADATAGSPTFDAIGTGTNKSATLTVDSGASIAHSGSGTIAATTSDTAAALAATLTEARFPALDGDVTTSAGDFTTAIAANAVTPSKVSAILRTRSLKIIVTGSGTAGVLQDTDDVLTDVFYNNLGQGVTLTGVSCKTDSATATRIQLQRDDGSPASILTDNTGAGVDCSSTRAAGAINTNEDNIANTQSIKLLIVTAGGAGKELTVDLLYTLD